MDGGVGRKQ